MKVLIVGRTQMGGSSRCIGGLTDHGRPLRLLTPSGGHWPTADPFQIGHIWDVQYTPAAAPVPPHTEDVMVSKRDYVAHPQNLREAVLQRIGPWHGGIDQLFGGALEYTGGDNGYVSARKPIFPPHSTCFWVPDQKLTLRSDGKHYDYPYGYQSRGLKYVGEPRAQPSIAAGTLVRVSLAKWWKPSNAASDFEERCYLQLSGWF